MTLEHIIPFSSDRKYSGAVFEDNGTYLMGAAQFLFPEGREDILDVCQNYAEEGLRVLVLAHSTQMAEGTELPDEPGTGCTSPSDRCHPRRSAGYVDSSLTARRLTSR